VVTGWILHYGSYCLAPFGLAGMWIARTNRWGWALSMFTQLLWLTYAQTTAQYGFMIGTVAYLGVYIRNFLHPEQPKRELCGAVGDNGNNWTCVLDTGHNLPGEPYWQHIDREGDTW
jgi:hypothetical protein